MSQPDNDWPAHGYIELSSPQFLDDVWHELNFDLTADQSVLQDVVVPETGSGHIYNDAKMVGSAVHNRFICWRTANDTLELVEMSPDIILDGNQVRIKFIESPIINNVNIIEFPDHVVIMVATATSVHRLHLPHPKMTNKSILYELTSDVLYNPANYYILNDQGSASNKQPVCASSWHDNGIMKCSLSFPDSSLLIVKFGRHSVSTYEIKQVGIIGRLWSRMPSLIARYPDDCDNTVFISTPYYLEATTDTLLFTLCRDLKIRVFSTNDRECVCTHSLLRQADFSQSYTSHTMIATDLPMMQMFDSHLIIYMTENEPEFVVINYSHESGHHSLTEIRTIQAPMWGKLVDFSITKDKIWALATMQEFDSSLFYLDRTSLLNSEVGGDRDEEGVWLKVTLIDDYNASDQTRSLAEIFERNHFSATTIRKALMGILGESIPKDASIDSLEEIARAKLTNQNQEENLTRLYNYCLQTHQSANKNIGLFTSNDETLVIVVRRGSPSFVCPLRSICRNGPHRLIDPSPCLTNLIDSLDYISTEVMTDEYSNLLERIIYESPAQGPKSFDEMVSSLVRANKISLSSGIYPHKTNIIPAIDDLCDQLDIASQANEYGRRALEAFSQRLRPEQTTLCSNSGIILTYELFRRTVQSRFILARDLLVYIYAMNKLSDVEKKSASEKFLSELSFELFSSSRVAKLMDVLRSYAVLVYIVDAHIKPKTRNANPSVIKFLSQKFEFFQEAQMSIDKNTSLDLLIDQNMFMSFLARGGINYSSCMDSPPTNKRSLSSTHYVSTVVENLCKLLWPNSNHYCLQEFMFVHQLDEHLAKYLDLTQDWVKCSEHDQQFLRAANNLLQNKADESVRIFNLLLMNISAGSLIGRFLGIELEDSTLKNSNLIYKYYERLVQLFQTYGDNRCLVLLINHCMSLLDPDADPEQNYWVNCFRAKLFQYYLELGDSDEAYHTMTLTTDQSLRFNCLRKFVVHHCEREQWLNLISYPFIDINQDFIKILNQKADSSDLSKLNDEEIYKTTYYDLLFSYHVCDEEYRLAAEIMYNYALRLAFEVPGIVSIRKQCDCLLVALNALRIVRDPDAYVEAGSLRNKDEGRSSVMKRARDSEFFSYSKLPIDSDSDFHRATCSDIKLRYELTRARLRLLEKDQTANAIALSPLKPDEIITQLVASSMFPSAIDLALLFKSSLDSILVGLTAKYISIMRLSTVDIAVHQDLERDLSDIFSDSYSNIDTYNYIANSTTSFVEKLWRLIDFYLTSYDGVNHKYRPINQLKCNNTVLMRVVAEKLLSVGYDIPASLRRMYMTRYTPELLKLLIKYDKLKEAADLTVEMIDRLMEPANSVTFDSKVDLPAVYLPTHLILLLITYLGEDATKMSNLKISEVLADRLTRYRRFVRC